MRLGFLNQPQIWAAAGINTAMVVMLTAVLWQVPTVMYHAPPHTLVLASKPNITVAVGKPAQLFIPSLGMQLAVQEGAFNAQTREWKLSDTSAMHATNSVPPNNSNGTTLLYGHGTPAVFASLVNLQKGDTAQVQATNGDIYVYRYSKKQDVTPDNTSIFRVDGPPTLVLQTCSGPWDSLRSLYAFTLVKVRHAHVG